MKQSYIIAVVAFIVLLAGVVFFGFSGNKEDTNPTPSTPDAADNRPEVTINAKHQWKDGTHTVAGEIEMPTPCHIIDNAVEVAESFPEQIRIYFTMETNADVCTQVITPARFKIDIQASEMASIEAKLNGEKAVLNLIEAGPDEDLDDFELFIKG